MSNEVSAAIVRVIVPQLYELVARLIESHEAHAAVPKDLAIQVKRLVPQVYQSGSRKD